MLPVKFDALICSPKKFALLTVAIIVFMLIKFTFFLDVISDQNISKVAVQSHYVIFSAYTYHSAKRVNKALVTITYSSNTYDFPFKCMARNQSGWFGVQRARNYHADERFSYCKMLAFVAHCYLPAAETYFLIKDGTKIELPVTKAYEKREPLVVCTSPSYLYELWMTALVSIETTRYFGATLRVVYIQSIIADLYTILKAYEKEEIVLIKHGFDLPRLEDHPESDQGHHHNQVIAINDCLNQFKDAADFIFVGDFDDMFITSFKSRFGVGSLVPAFDKHYSMVDVLKKEAQHNPNTGVFIFEWIGGDQNLTREDDNFTIYSTIKRQSTRPSKWISVGKYAMIPRRIKSAWVHWAMIIEDSYGTMKYDETVGTIVFHLNKPVWGRPTLNDDGEGAKFELDQHLRSVIRKHGVENEFLRLPQHPIHFDYYSKCFDYGNHQLVNERKFFCPSYAKCDFRQQNETRYIISNAHFDRYDYRAWIGSKKSIFIYRGGVLTDSRDGQREMFKQTFSYY